jgi:5S rRNA maturation endonuclease (ribonuclease M5)
LSTRLKHKEEKIVEVLDALACKSSQGTPIVVEGKKDLDALRSFDIAGPVLTFKTGGKSFIDAVGEIEATRATTIILLLDFDRRGKEATNQIKQYLERAKIKVELKYWRTLQALLRHDVQSIEGLTSYVATLRTKTALM